MVCLKVELTESDIKEAIADYVRRQVDEGLVVNVGDIQITTTKLHDMRGEVSGYRTKAVATVKTKTS